MTDIDLVVQSDWRLRPSLPADLEKIKKHKPGKILKATVIRRRNAAHHRKFFALLGALMEHTDYEDIDDFLDDIKLKLKMIESYRVDYMGRVVIKTKSISWTEMDQDKFDIFYRRTIDVLLNDFVEGWTEGHIDKALEEVRAFG